MKFRTEIEPIKGLQGRIDHRSVIFTIGSCFSDSIADCMLSEGFDVEANPLGTLYNPLSILRSVDRLTHDNIYTPGELFEYEGKYRSYDFHSMFSRRTAGETAAMINSRLNHLRSRLPQLTTLLLTFGSARCFRLKSTGQPVANCHKQHPDLFDVEDISLANCIEAIGETISLMQRCCPALRDVILTVSPIRHKAYGLHADRLSKSMLLLACDSIVNAFARDSAAALRVSYYPSYEIMMDDLRDYRFYAADMLHPSETAVSYIYSHFSDTFYTPATRAEAAARLRALRRTLHRSS